MVTFRFKTMLVSTACSSFWGKKFSCVWILTYINGSRNQNCAATNLAHISCLIDEGTRSFRIIRILDPNWNITLSSGSHGLWMQDLQTGYDIDVKPQSISVLCFTRNKRMLLVLMAGSKLHVDKTKCYDPAF